VLPKTTKDLNVVGKVLRNVTNEHLSA